MRIQLIFLSLFFSINIYANDDKDIKHLLTQYSEVIRQHKIELIENVFTQKFLLENGGKKEFENKVKTLPISKIKDEFNWKKGLKGNLYLAQIKAKLKSESQLIIVKEDGKWKINGTINDAN